jgi:hypothetical protein
VFFAPILLVKKSNASWCFYVDYRVINEKMVKDKFPISVVEELLNELHGTQFFTKLDLCSGYHQVLMHPDDVTKMAFRTHQGLFEFLVMPFGLTNVSATFLVLMNEVLRLFLHCFIMVFFDDILIYSGPWHEHLQHVRLVFSVLQAHKLFMKRTKCSFRCTKVSDLGHIISAVGVSMDLQKVHTVLDWPVPESMHTMRVFLSLADYYRRRFIREYGTIAAPLTKLTRKGGFCWDEAVGETLCALKRTLTTVLVFQLPY